MSEIDKTRRAVVMRASVVIGGGVGLGLVDAALALNHVRQYQDAEHAAETIEGILQKYHFSQWTDLQHPFIPSWGEYIEEPAIPQERAIFSTSTTLPAVKGDPQSVRTLREGFNVLLTPAVEGTVFFPSDPTNWDIYARGVDRPVQISTDQQ